MELGYFWWGDLCTNWDAPPSPKLENEASHRWIRRDARQDLERHCTWTRWFLDVASWSLQKELYIYILYIYILYILYIYILYIYMYYIYNIYIYIYPWIPLMGWAVCSPTRSLIIIHPTSPKIHWKITTYKKYKSIIEVHIKSLVLHVLHVLHTVPTASRFSPDPPAFTTFPALRYSQPTTLRPFCSSLKTSALVMIRARCVFSATCMDVGWYLYELYVYVYNYLVIYKHNFYVYI